MPTICLTNQDRGWELHPLQLKTSPSKLPLFLMVHEKEVPNFIVDSAVAADEN